MVNPSIRVRQTVGVGHTPWLPPKSPVYANLGPFTGNLRVLPGYVRGEVTIRTKKTP